MFITSKISLNTVIIFLALLSLVTSTTIRAENVTEPSYSRSVHDYKIPNVNVVTQDGKKTKFSEVLNHGGPVIVNFIFTSCNAICPIMTAILSKVNATIGSSSPNLRFVSISIDPEHDSPSMLAKYAKKFNASSNWQFLTGDIAEIQQIQRAFDAYRGDKMNHASLTLMRASSTSSWVRIEGIASPDELIREYTLLR